MARTKHIAKITIAKSYNRRFSHQEVIELSDYLTGTLTNGNRADGSSVSVYFNPVTSTKHPAVEITVYNRDMLESVIGNVRDGIQYAGYKVKNGTSS
jgi:hypothetical protein